MGGLQAIPEKGRPVRRNQEVSRRSIPNPKTPTPTTAREGSGGLLLVKRSFEVGDRLRQVALSNGRHLTRQTIKRCLK